MVLGIVVIVLAAVLVTLMVVCVIKAEEGETQQITDYKKNKIYDTYEVNAELYERKVAVLFDGRYGYYK